jgi:hypothetical protein
MLRGLHCSLEKLATVREAIESGDAGSIGEVVAPSLRWAKARRSREAVGLAQEGTGLLDMATTAHLYLHGMSPNSKRKLLSLLFTRCS